VLPPVNPPSSYRPGRATHPSPVWLRTYASPASRWASRELNSWSSPSSVDFRVYTAHRTSFTVGRGHVVVVMRRSRCG
jgi:hypothetical protein